MRGKLKRQWLNWLQTELQMFRWRNVTVFRESEGRGNTENKQVQCVQQTLNTRFGKSDTRISLERLHTVYII